MRPPQAALPASQQTGNTPAPSALHRGMVTPAQRDSDREEMVTLVTPSRSDCRPYPVPLPVSIPPTCPSPFIPDSQSLTLRLPPAGPGAPTLQRARRGRTRGGWRRHAPMRLRNSAAASATLGLSCGLSGGDSMPRLGALAAGPSVSLGAPANRGTRPTRDPGGAVTPTPPPQSPTPVGSPQAPATHGSPPCRTYPVPPTLLRLPGNALTPPLKGAAPRRGV